MNYGLPYKGSKNRIAQWIIDQLPPAENFYDLFGGGGAITHCAMLSGKWKNFYLNDIRPGLTECFAMALQGEYKKPEYHRWISRDEFNEIKNGITHSDCYFALVWSFGNDMQTYIYSRDIEPAKKHAFENMDTRAIRVQNLERVKRIENIERTQRIENIERTKRIENIKTSCTSYDQIDIEDNSVVYCDIPYFETCTFRHCQNFDYEKFYEWCTDMARQWHGKNIKLYISEYEMPKDFTVIAKKEKFTSSAYKKRKHAVEKLFVPDGQELYGQTDLLEGLS